MTVSLAGRRHKGNRAEREVLSFLRDHLGDHIVRARGEGAQDHGDIAGLPHTVVQVKNFADITRAVREGLAGAAEQKANAGLMWGAAFIRRRGGRYMVCMDADDWISMFREAVMDTHARRPWPCILDVACEPGCCREPDACRPWVGDSIPIAVMEAKP